MQGKMEAILALQEVPGLNFSSGEDLTCVMHPILNSHGLFCMQG